MEMRYLQSVPHTTDPQRHCLTRVHGTGVTATLRGDPGSDAVAPLGSEHIKKKTLEDDFY